MRKEVALICEKRLEVSSGGALRTLWESCELRAFALQGDRFLT